MPDASSATGTGTADRSPRLLVAVGDLVEDVVVVANTAPRLGTDTPAWIRRRRGGSAANTAAAAVRGGARARFVGRVGNDASGRELVRRLGEEGVEVIVEHHGRTGTVVVLVNCGERSFLTDRGASAELAAIPSEALRDADWLHVPAYSLAAGPLASATRELIEANPNVPLSIDASSVALLEDFGRDAFLASITRLGTDVLFANEDEAAVLALPERARAAGIPIVVVKQGADATIVTSARETARVDPEPIVGPFDPTGAGDAFAAGFVLAHLAGASIGHCAAAGNALAHEILTTPRASW